jgi:hypothetical protein
MTRLVAAGALLALGISLVTPGLAAADTGAQRGGANASADSMSFQIVNGGASLGWTFGRSIAAYRDVSATSQGLGLDMGALEALFTLPRCGGAEDALFRAEALPEKTVADSNGPLTKAGPVEVRFPGIEGQENGRVVGTQWAEAAKQPKATASTASVDQDFGFFRVEGAESSATTEYVDGVRTAHAVSLARRIIVLNGLAIFNNARWEATARSGADSSSTASFTFDSVKVFGNWVTGAQIGSNFAFLKALIETLLGPLGVTFELPTVGPAPADDGVSISPLRIRLGPGPFAKGVLLPFLNADLMQRVREDTINEDCRRADFWTVIDAVQYALGGSGGIDTSVGGASASTTDTDFSYTPLPEAPATTAPATTVPETTAPPAGDLAFDSSFDSGFDSSFDSGFDSSFDSGLDSSFDSGLDEGITDTSLDTAAGATAEVAEVEEAADAEEIAAPAKPSGTSDTAAVVVGVLALLGAVGLSLGDRVAGIRAGRRIP